MQAGEIPSLRGMIGGLKQPGEEGGDGGFDAQDALTELDRVQTRCAQQLDFIGNPATFRADRQRHRLLDGTGARREVPRVPDQSQCAVDDGGQTGLQRTA